MAVCDTSIPDLMRACVCHGKQDYRADTVKVPTLGEQELLVRVERCGLCAGDAKCYSGADAFWGTKENKPIVEPPVIPGHEFVGVVAACGAGAESQHGVSVGDRVTAEQVLECGSCLYCKRGMRWICDRQDIFGFKQVVPGGVAEYMILPAHSRVHKVPSSLPASEAVYVEPLSCAAHGVERAGIMDGDTVVVSGCGPIGLGMIASIRGGKQRPARLLAIDCSDSRLEIARKCGADVVLNATKTDVVKEIRGMCDNYGCDVYLEATGNPASVVQGINACRKAATFVEFSVFKEPTVLDWTLIGDTKELNVKGGHCSGENGYKFAIDLIASGRLPMSSIVTHALPLAEVVQGLQMVDEGANSATGSVKVTIDPTLEN